MGETTPESIRDLWGEVIKLALEDLKYGTKEEKQDAKEWLKGGETLQTACLAVGVDPEALYEQVTSILNEQGDNMSLLETMTPEQKKDLAERLLRISDLIKFVCLTLEKTNKVDVAPPMLSFGLAAALEYLHRENELEEVIMGLRGHMALMLELREKHKKEDVW
jgi:hypothetical protein